MESRTRRAIRICTTIVRSDARTVYWFSHEQPYTRREAKAILYGLWITLVGMLVATALITAALYAARS